MCQFSSLLPFPAGWAIAARERDWKYRLSIYYAKAQDSGVYTCSTPRGLSNSIRVHVVGKFNPPLVGRWNTDDRYRRSVPGVEPARTTVDR